jgi:hypothetical protein
MERDMSIKASDDIYFTLSMAEVLEKQGYYEDALTIYKILSDTSPEDPELKQRLDNIKALGTRGSKRLVARL